jgi:hypothetical protein
MVLGHFGVLYCSSLNMSLKIFGKQANQEAEQANSHTFLCLMFVNQSVQAALWKVAGEKIVTLAQSSLLTFENDEDGLIKADQALQELGSESENINQVVFGFDPEWVNESGLIKAKKTFIKSVTDNLSLNPVGFVVITDALVQQILSKDSMASEVLVYLQDDIASIFLLKQGKLVEQLSVGRSADIVQDIVEGLARFAQQLSGSDARLPAKLVLASPILSAPEIDNAQQQIANYDWSENHPFVQTPVVESMLSLDVLYAVVEQGGTAVAESKGLKGKQAHQQTDETLSAGAEDFGFKNVSSPVEKGDNFSAPSKEENYATSFGVPITDDKLPETKEPMTANTPITPKSPNGGKRKLLKFLQKINNWYSNHPHKKAIAGGAIGGVLALLALFIGWTVFAYQTEISVRLAQEVITKEVVITVDPTIANSNPEKQILKAELESVEVEGRETVDTTGVTLIGERASGEVTIFNKTTAPKEFAAGTSISTGEVAFTLNDNVTVASASSEQSGSNQLVTTFGEETAQVTASEIGADSNMGEGTELTVDNFSTDTYSARAKETFSGGSSREVRVVSKEDQTNVLQFLKDKLIDDAAQQFTDRSGNGTYFVPTGGFEVAEANYDIQVGEEADQLTLDLVLEVSAVKYLSEDLRPLIEEALQDDVPEGFELVDEEPDILSSPRDNEATSSSIVILDASVETKARPPFDVQSAIDSILGLSFEEMTNNLTDRSEVEQATYSLRPRIADWFVSKVPRDASRVNLEITNITEEE